MEIVAFDCLQKALPTKLEPASFVTDMNKEWKSNSAEWRKIRKLLADDESKKVFDDLVRFRLTGSYKHMSDYQVKLQNQYFDNVCSLREKEVFVDCGGFDGDTTEEFIYRCPKYGYVWLFEASEKNMPKAKGRLAKKTRYSVRPKRSFQPFGVFEI